MSLYLVTGGAGFIGSHIVTALVARGDRARVLDDLSSGTLANLEPLDVGEPGSGAPVEFLRGDVADPEPVRCASEGVAGIFHEAAQVSVPASFEDPRRSYEVNVLGTLHVLEGARRAGTARVVLAASSAAYGDSEELPKVESMVPQPLSPYASGKLAGEALLATWGQMHGIRATSLRYFNVFGPRQADDSPYSGVIALFARRLLAGEPVRIHGDGGQTRDFVFVEDVVRANLTAMDADLAPGEVFNVGTGRSISLLELHGGLAKLAGRDEPPRHGPPRVGDVRHSRADVSHIQARLGWRSQVDFEEGLRITFEWYRSQGS